ncbi:MAG: hypothetical protein ACRDGV_06740 [Candidatus Limnocylindria bacterium]
MRWLERHAWWVLLLFALLLVTFGVTDVVVGPAADRAIPMALTGLTPEEIEAEGAAGYRLFDFFTRANGFSLVGIGLLATAILVFAFRRNQRWAWWAMWVLPLWAAGALVFYLVAGVEPDQPPPPPMISGPILAVLSAAALLVSAPRFFRGDPHEG